MTDSTPLLGESRPKVNSTDWPPTLNRSLQKFGSTNTSLGLHSVRAERMKGGHDRHAEFPQQLQDVAPSRPAENAVLVLHANQIDIGEIEEFGSTAARMPAPLR